MRVYRMKLKIAGKNQIVAVKGPNMIQLVAACEKSGIKYEVVKCLGRI